MLINPTDFNGGVVFEVIAETESERVLLHACVDEVTFTYGSEETSFYLNLPVSN